MKLSTPSIFLAAVILSEVATGENKLGRQVDRRRHRRRSTNDAAKRGERSLSRTLEGFSMDNSMSLDMSRGGGSGGSGKSGKQPPLLYNVESEVEINFRENFITGDQRYVLTLSFKHDENLPVPDGPDQCNPLASGGPALAPDNKPYLATREFNTPLSDEIYQATGFASIGLDYQACGHPPMNVFTKPHYDVHFYTDSMEVRDEWTCEQPPNAPICKSDFKLQNTNSGRAFFNVQYATPKPNEEIVQPSNMPGTTNGVSINNGGIVECESSIFVSCFSTYDGSTFECDAEAAIPKQGIHCWDQVNQPASVDEWTAPVLIMGSYNGKIAFFEPMIPLPFVSDGSVNLYNELVEYEGQTVDSLPSQWTVRYNENDDDRTLVELAGKANAIPY